ncbi:signal peptidase I [Candidatus Endolissoclinum faulkneri L2]|uniref:Signal peptidase I n=1 Tax=Candidatus Endolissoclinum faulkneri L2 TaxID=1193729 RepID=K7Z634_9PROT|nr:signal peptidase I [Candidatus Endolissoclinum faulkneri]AFX99613.1 signal peptidase I [Candidatus Endolissoclinum faulkneri L2]
MTGKNSSVYREFIRTVIVACALSFTIRTFFYEPFNIPSGSMIPTLLVGDYLFVSKASYGYSLYSIPIINRRIFFIQPKLGDVVVFRLASDNKTNYIKRIVGLPGDDIQVKNGILHINGEPVKRRRIKNFNFENDKESSTQFIETLPNGREHRIIEYSDNNSADNTPIYHVPAKHYFAMGDNRDNSQDSRFSEVGTISEENLVGRADILFFSHSEQAKLWEIWKWPFVIRYSRILEKIE